jgi:S1-C subfamily serine protease
MIGKFSFRPGRALIVALMMTTLAALAFAQPSAEKGKGSATSTTMATGPGVLVVAVASGSPAEKAGITRGDIILAADGKDISTANQLQQAVAAHKSGDALSLKIKHGDAEKTVSVTLADLNNRTYLGVEPLASGLAMRAIPGFRRLAIPDGRSGALVANVVAGSPAEKAGLKSGDVIVSVDGTAVGPQSDLAGLIAPHKAGDTLTLSVASSGQQPRDVKVTLDKNPQKPDSPYLGVQYTLAGAFAMGPGMPRMFARPFGNNRNAVSQGVIVDAVADNSPAAQAGIKPRDIITAIDGVTVLSPRQVVETVTTHKSGDTLTLTVFRFNENKETQISVTLGQAPASTGTSAAPAPQGTGQQASGGYLGITMSRYMGWTSPDGDNAVDMPQSVLPQGSQDDQQPESAPAPVSPGV